MTSQAGLSSMLVRDRVVSPDAMAQAIERQHLFRVSLDTALLELELADERTMRTYLSRLTGLPAAKDELLGAASAAAASFPREWAEALGAAPCEVESDVVDLVVFGRVEAARVREVEERCGVTLRLWAAPEFRVREAFARVYGGALTERHRRLVARLGAGGTSTTPAVPQPEPARAPDPGRALAPERPPSSAASPLPTPRSRSVSALASFLEGSSRRDEVLDALTRFVQSRFAYGQVFLVSRNVIAPAGARKPRLLADEPSVLSNVVTGGIAYRGPLPRGNQALFMTLGRRPPAELVAAPLVVGDRVVAVLWGDQGDEPLGPAADELIEAVPFAERALARLVLERRAAGEGG